MRCYREMTAVFLIILSVGLATAAPGDRQLPFVAGETWWCSQDWNVCPGTHCNEKAWDFNWSYGSSDLGKPLLAPSAGRIRFAEDTYGSYGKVVLIEYADGTFDRIAHCDAIVVQEGENVNQGQAVAFCGGSGGFPVHLHINNQSSADPSASGSYSLESYFDYRQDGDDFYQERPLGCNCESDPPSEYHYISRNAHMLDTAYDRFGADLIGQPEYVMWDLQTARAANASHPWFYEWDHTNRYRGQGIPNNCVIQHLDGGFYWDGTIVYDGLGGARQAYILHSGFWTYWTTDDGPRSPLGMPITDEYSFGTNKARQDFQLQYLLYEQGASPEITIHPYVAPGWTDHGWEPQYSYLFADAYNRNGSAVILGNADGIVVDNWIHGGMATAYSIQTFKTTDQVTGMIVYDPDNYDPIDFPDATNEAYYIYGDFYLAFTGGRLADGTTLPWVLGAPTRDREGNVQYFKFGRMEDHDGLVIAYDGDGVDIWRGVMEIAGSRIGTLYAHNSPYKVLGQLSVPAGQTLTIEPGCEFIFQGHYKFIVNSGATLLAVGTETDSIKFTAADKTDGWHGIRFLNASSESLLEYCVIEYGNAYPDAGWDDWGGGVFCYYSDPTISNCLIRFNKALVGIIGGGGGIAIAHSSPVVSQCTITENQATRRGGGGILSYASSVTATGNEISNNTSFYRGGGMLVEYGSATVSDNKFISNTTSLAGGGFWSWAANVTLSQNEFTRNEARFGGGIYVEAGTIHIDENVVSGNTVNGNKCAGAGIDFGSHSVGTISNNTIFDNQVLGNGSIAGGGGIYCTRSSPDIFNNDIYGNNGSLIGGGIYCRDLSFPEIHNNTIHDNRAGYGGGIGSGTSTPIIVNNSIKDNSAGNGPGVFTSSYSVINAQNNWWGDISGPYDPSDGPPCRPCEDETDPECEICNNPGGTGNGVSDYVTYWPWLNYSPDVQGLVDQAVAQLSGGFSQKIAEPGHVSTDVSSTVQLLTEVVSEAWQIILNWPGSELNLKVYQPDGTLFGEWQSTVPPIIAEMIPANTGTWNFEVTAIDIPNDNYPFALVVGSAPIGSISGIVEDSNQIAILGAAIDVSDSTGATVYMTHTDITGNFEFPYAYLGQYTVMLLPPFGYTADFEELPVLVIQGVDSSVSFTVTRLDVIPSQKRMSYWRHELNEVVFGDSTGSEPIDSLCFYSYRVRRQFNEHPVNPIKSVWINSTDGCLAELESLAKVFNYRVKYTELDRQEINSSAAKANPDFFVPVTMQATQQIATLLLNVASGKIAPYTPISEDNATVSQAITYCDSLIAKLSGNCQLGESLNDCYERSRDIASAINAGLIVKTGYIPLDIPQYTYKSDESFSLPDQPTLAQNYPNPFNPVTTISYSLPEAALVRIEVFNILGQKVKTLVDERQVAGDHLVTWDASKIASGVYFYRLTTGDAVETQKMLLLK